MALTIIYVLSPSIVVTAEHSVNIITYWRWKGIQFLDCKSPCAMWSWESILKFTQASNIHEVRQGAFLDTWLAFPVIQIPDWYKLKRSEDTW